MPLVRSLLLLNFKHASAPINFEAWKQSPCGWLDTLPVFCTIKHLLSLCGSGLQKHIGGGGWNILPQIAQWWWWGKSQEHNTDPLCHTNRLRHYLGYHDWVKPRTEMTLRAQLVFCTSCRMTSFYCIFSPENLVLHLLHPSPLNSSVMVHHTWSYPWRTTVL